MNFCLHTAVIFEISLIILDLTIYGVHLCFLPRPTANDLTVFTISFCRFSISIFLFTCCLSASIFFALPAEAQARLFHFSVFDFSPLVFNFFSALCSLWYFCKEIFNSSSSTESTPSKTMLVAEDHLVQFS